MEWLVVGLGNPGGKYQGHRHNVGFMITDLLARSLGGAEFREKFSGLFARGPLDGHELGLLKPQTYMNLSGTSVQKALAFFKLGLAQLVVVHDELDLPFGTVRIKTGGGLAGHNGLRSIAQHCGGAEFLRVRVGIGRPRSGGGESHVLSDFSKDECVTLPTVLESASLAVSDIARRGVSAAMNQHNQTPKAAKPSKNNDAP